LRKLSILALTAVFVTACSVADIAYGKPVPRTEPISGRIVAKRAGETAALVPISSQQPLEVRQNLKAGDIVRTNAAGQLAIAFADGTQIRMARNTTLRVDKVSGRNPTSISVDSGKLWIRAPRNRSNLNVETPAVAAAIRGTSWSISVVGDRSTIEVYEGSVFLSNPQGNLQVEEGQVAGARVGEAPSRLAIVPSDERSQLFYYMPVGDIIRNFPPTGVEPVEARKLRANILAIESSQRSAEDWLTIAELSTGVDSEATRAGYLANIDLALLDSASRARFVLVEALILASAGELPGAKDKLKQAMPELHGQRRIAAEVLIAMAEQRTEGGLPAGLSQGDGEDSLRTLAAALMAAHNGDLERAIILAQTGETQFPTDVNFPLVIGHIAVLLGDRNLLAKAIDRAFELDSGHYSAFILRSLLNADYDGKLDAAIADALHATELAPENHFAWGTLARAHMLRRDYLAADIAYLQTIALAPNDAAAHANRAINLMEQHRFNEAEAEMERADAIDPSNPALLTVRGRLSIQRGRRSEAGDYLVDALASQPNYAPALLLYADVLAGMGDEVVAGQQLDAAARYDPGNELPEIYRSAFALDAYLPEKALHHARMAHDLVSARDPDAAHSDLATIDSYASDSLIFLGLDSWANFHSDRSFSQTNPNALFARSAIGQPNPYLLSRDALSLGNLLDVGSVPPGVNLTDVVQTGAAVPISTASLAPSVGNIIGHDVAQNFASFNAQAGTNSQARSLALAGLAISPLAIARPQRHVSFLDEEFAELSVKGSGIVANGEIGNAQSVAVSGASLGALPFGYSIGASRVRWNGANAVHDGRSQQTAYGAIGIELGPVDNFSLLVSRTKNNIRQEESTPVGPFYSSTRLSSTSATASYGHAISEDIVLKLGGNFTKSDFHREKGFHAQRPTGRINDAVQSQQLSAGLISETDAYFVNIGLDYSKRNFAGSNVGFGSSDAEPFAVFRDELRVRGNFGVTATDGLNANILAGYHRSRGQDRLEYGVDISLAPSSRDMFRLAYEDVVHSQTAFSYVPRYLVGLQADGVPTRIGDSSSALIVRWDREWSDRFFTAVELQRWDVGTSRLADFDKINSLEAIGSNIIGTGPLNRVSAVANILLPENFGVSLTYIGSFANNHLYLPQHFARIGLVWSHDTRVRFNSTLTYASERRSKIDSVMLDDYISFDAGMRWISRDHRYEASLDVYNIFDNAADISIEDRDYGRAIVSSLGVRF